MIDHTLETPRFKLGDRVRVNATCDYSELVGTEWFVTGMRRESNGSISVECSARASERPLDDGWVQSELDLVPDPPIYDDAVRIALAIERLSCELKRIGVDGPAAVVFSSPQDGFALERAVLLSSSLTGKPVAGEGKLLPNGSVTFEMSVVGHRVVWPSNLFRSHVVPSAVNPHHQAMLSYPPEMVAHFTAMIEHAARERIERDRQAQAA
jgi:hypothetical protein